jgi:hypothetical protein
MIVPGSADVVRRCPRISASRPGRLQPRCARTRGRAPWRWSGPGWSCPLPAGPKQRMGPGESGSCGSRYSRIRSFTSYQRSSSRTPRVGDIGLFSVSFDQGRPTATEVVRITYSAATGGPGGEPRSAASSPPRGGPPARFARAASLISACCFVRSPSHPGSPHLLAEEAACPCRSWTRSPTGSSIRLTTSSSRVRIPEAA